MSKYLSVAMMALLLAACEKPAEQTEKSSNSDFNVERLFKTDGCTIYRFHDNRAVYFAKCQGSDSSQAMAQECHLVGKVMVCTNTDAITEYKP